MRPVARSAKSTAESFLGRSQPTNRFGNTYPFMCSDALTRRGPGDGDDPRRNELNKMPLRVAGVERSEPRIAGLWAHSARPRPPEVVRFISARAPRPRLFASHERRVDAMRIVAVLDRVDSPVRARSKRGNDCSSKRGTDRRTPTPSKRGNDREAQKWRRIGAGRDSRLLYQTSGRRLGAGTRAGRQDFPAADGRPSITRKAPTALR